MATTLPRTRRDLYAVATVRCPACMSDAGIPCRERVKKRVREYGQMMRGGHPAVHRVRRFDGRAVRAYPCSECGAAVGVPCQPPGSFTHAARQGLLLRDDLLRREKRPDLAYPGARSNQPFGMA